MSNFFDSTEIFFQSCNNNKLADAFVKKKFPSRSIKLFEFECFLYTYNETEKHWILIILTDTYIFFKTFLLFVTY